MTISINPARIFPLGDSALTVEFGAEMSDELNIAAIRLSELITRDPFPGFIEAVPAIASTTIFYDPSGVLRGSSVEVTAYSLVHDLVRERAANLELSTDSNEAPTFEIPVSFGRDDALDIDDIAGYVGLSIENVIATFISSTYRVFMLGFLPGFAYMGTVDENIAVPRKRVPRLTVPAGSVGIAGRQTGIYPSASPGGWQIIGRTATNMLAGAAGSPCLLKPGDKVRFVRS